MKKMIALIAAALIGGQVLVSAPAAAYDGCTGIVKVKSVYRPSRRSGYLSMRTGPGTGYRELYHLLRNTEVLVFDHSGSWWQIHYNGVTGWAHGRWIRLYCP